MKKICRDVGLLLIVNRLLTSATARASCTEM